MENTFKNGIKRAMAFYVIAFAAVLLTALLFGHSYAHGPAPYHMVFFLFVLIAIGLLIINLFRIKQQ